MEIEQSALHWALRDFLHFAATAAWVRRPLGRIWYTTDRPPVPRVGCDEQISWPGVSVLLVTAPQHARNTLPWRSINPLRTYPPSALVTVGTPMPPGSVIDIVITSRSMKANAS